MYQDMEKFQYEADFDADGRILSIRSRRHSVTGASKLFVVPPPSRRPDIVVNAHLMGHRGTFKIKTSALIEEQGYSWLGMYEDVNTCLAGCTVCRLDNAATAFYHAAQAIPVPHLKGVRPRPHRYCRDRRLVPPRQVPLCLSRRRRAIQVSHRCPDRGQVGADSRCGVVARDFHLRGADSAGQRQRCRVCQQHRERSYTTAWRGNAPRHCIPPTGQRPSRTLQPFPGRHPPQVHRPGHRPVAILARFRTDGYPGHSPRSNRLFSSPPHVWPRDASPCRLLCACHLGRGCRPKEDKSLFRRDRRVL
eukprot:m.217435 g.217435  ORF g.217435 m.217435 type:complete len:305 (-) comp15601_c0_seq5:1086-2000(-)